MFQIVTISNRVPTEWYYTYNQFFRSLDGNDVLLLGQLPGEYTGLSDKPRILYNAINEGKIKEDIIVFLDCWDIVVASDMDEIMYKFKNKNCDISIGAEKNCFPECFRKEYDKWAEGFSSSYKYLNSGIIIGYRDAIMTALEAMDAPNLPVDYHDGRTGRNYHFNDQAYYMDIALRQPVSIKLDRSCWIGQNMQDVSEEEIDFCQNRRIRNLETGEQPCIIHWNGSSKDKWSREPILKHLNLL